MKKLIGIAGLIAALSVGCASTEPEQAPPDYTGEPIPLVQEPQFEVPDNLDDYPDFYRRGKCILRAAKGRLRDEEFDNFVDGFSEEFFGVCFTSIDPDVLNKAREDANLYSELPPGAALAEMANKAKCDFTVFVTLDMRDRALEASDQVNRRDVSGKVRANATVNLVGSATKQTKEIATTLKLDQIFSTTQKQELKGRLAKMMGRAVARKLLGEKVAQSKGVSAENVFSITFKGFDNEEKRELRDILKEIGVRSRDMREVSAGGKADQFTFRINSTMNMGEFRDALEDALEGNDMQYKVRMPEASLMIITNANR